MEPHGSHDVTMKQGGDEMRNLAKTCAMVVCFGVAGSAWAQGGFLPTPLGGGPARTDGPKVGAFRPMAMVSAPKTPLLFGMVTGMGPKQLKAQGTARVAANCPYRVMASFRGMTEPTGKSIPTHAMTATINGKSVPIGTDFVQIAAGNLTPMSGLEVPLVVEVMMKGSGLYPAGRYSGNLVLKVVAGS